MRKFDVAAVRESIGRVVQLLTRRRITVTQRGMDAYVAYSKADGSIQSVNIPYLPDTATEEFVSAVQGFLDHEVGHVLFSDAKIITGAAKKGPRIASMHNLFEDTFIERMMQGEFRGSEVNLNAVRSFHLEKITKPALVTAMAIGDERAAQGRLMMVQVRAWAGQTTMIDFLKAHPEYDALLEDFREAVGEDIIDQIPLMKTSSECLVLAERAVRRMIDWEEHKEEERRAAAGGSGKRPALAKPADASGGDTGMTAPEMARRPEIETPTPEEEEAARKAEEEAAEEKASLPAPEEGDDDSEDDGPAPAEETDEEEEAPAPDPESEEEEEGAGEEEEEGGPPAPSMLDALEESADFDGDIAKVIGEEAAVETKRSGYPVFSSEWDVIEPAPECTSPATVAKLDEMVGTAAATMAKKLERAIASRDRKGFNPGMRSGRINTPALYRAAVGDDRVFRHRYVKLGKETAVSLSVDCSGSMSGDRIQMAGAAAYCMSQALERIGIKHEIIGFTTRDSAAMTKAMELEAVKHSGIYYGRNEALYMPVFKGFHERLSPTTRARIATMIERPRYLNENVDGECLLIAAQRLMRVPNVQRRVLLVFSDGQPACPPGYGLQKHLQRAVKTVEQDMHVVGIGIQNAAVANYYTKHVVLHSLADLQTTLMAQLSKLLLAD